MTRNILLSLLVLVGVGVGVGGCGDTPVIGDEGGIDATTSQDSSKADTGSSKDAGKDSTSMMDGSDVDADDDGGGMVDSGPDVVVLPDGGQCVNANDCKLFSSYCSTDPCKCIPLGKNDPNPKCGGSMVTCLIDPCNNKSAFCNNGKCDVQ